MGLSFQNIGLGLSYRSGSSASLPRLIRRGIAFEPISTLDVLLPTKELPFKLSTFLKYQIVYEKITDLVGEKHDTFNCEGYELTLLNLLSYRWGYRWEYFDHKLMPTETKGYAFKLGPISMEVAYESSIYDFDIWRVQTTVIPHEFSESKSIQADKRLNIAATLLSCLMLPGGGQFYNGNELKGLCFASLGFYLGDLYFHQPSGTKKTVSAVGLGILYLAGAAEALWTGVFKQ
ncbi:MAG: hypothetical protein QMD71_05375 [bacterium]|nr:hypothetical protein [bacterium]